MSLLNIVPEVQELIDQKLEDGDILGILNAPTLPGPVDTKVILGYLQSVGKWGKIKHRSTKPYSEDDTDRAITEICIEAVEAIKEFEYIHFERPEYAQAINTMFANLNQLNFLDDTDIATINFLATNKTSVASSKIGRDLSLQDISDIRHGRY